MTPDLTVRKPPYSQHTGRAPSLTAIAVENSRLPTIVYRRGPSSTDMISDVLSMIDESSKSNQSISASWTR